jgi:hypothetical protein
MSAPDKDVGMPDIAADIDLSSSQLASLRKMSSLLYPQGNGFLRVYSDSKQTFATVCILPKEITEILEYPEREPDGKVVTRREVITVDYKPSTAASHTVRLPTSKQTFDVWFKLENISLLPDADYQIQISKTKSQR